MSINEPEKRIQQLEEALAVATTRIAELESQLAQRTGKVQRVGHQQIDAILQPCMTAALSGEDNRLWAQ